VEAEVAVAVVLAALAEEVLVAVVPEATGKSQYRNNHSIINLHEAAFKAAFSCRLNGVKIECVQL
jgi:hypothetical protein